MYIALKNRALLKVEGVDARDFLQGLVSQDMNHVSDVQAVYSAFLSPQGKFLLDFFCFEMDGALILDCEEELAPKFLKRLKMYKLRSKVELSDISADYQVYATLQSAIAFGLKDADRGVCKTLESGVVYTDPRLRNMGCRAVLKTDDNTLEALGLTEGSFDEYEHQRLTLGLADGSRDMTVDKALLLENGFEELDGVSFSKGCFMGQELTARTKYRGLVKKRLLPVHISGDAPPPGSILMQGDKEIGEMKSSFKDMGLALIRLNRFEDGDILHYGNAKLTPSIPDWIVFQDKSDA